MWNEAVERTEKCSSMTQFKKVVQKYLSMSVFFFNICMLLDVINSIPVINYK